MESREMNLGGLIEKVKSEGIEEAKRQAEEIIAEASSRAADIAEEARKRADISIEEAGREIEKRKEAGRKALELAARDALIHVRRSIEDIFSAIIKKEYGRVVSGEILEKVLLKVVDGWQKNRNDNIDLEILLGENDQKALSEAFLSRLKQEVMSGVEIKVHPDIEKGFRIGGKGEHLHYDFTDEAVAELLSTNLNKELAEILKPVTGGKEKE